MSPSPNRPSSPVAGNKRARSPSDEDLRTAQAQKTSAAGGRPKARDYDDVTQEVISLAITLYRCLISTVNAFPDHATELEFIREVWSRACRELDTFIELTPTISKLISIRGSHGRGELKTKVKPLIEVTFGFRSGQNKKAIARNRELVEELKEKCTFTFKDIKARKGMYKNGLFQMAANSMWFANQRDEGPSYLEFFNLFPKPGFALLLTVVESLIDEWATGIRTDSAFTAKEYRSVYESHLKALQEFEEHTHPHTILENILVRLHNIGRCIFFLCGLSSDPWHVFSFHSGAQPIEAVSTSVLSKADLDAAIKEYEDDSGTETDGECGDNDDDE
ncbi:hypothetical protein B0H10DRAFT_340384 [Mycena sp. CBHHK59/15]|nr:hypothetical protein B0H10DRAFT_340384 [Mycena sp. CBHHK59/15]